ncbi:uncharacterized protein LOC107318792 [Coturnix japonica]|uniref:uncharacterized protein LOC107318792 n=1 Tax=Coturnix japonica TaxID=93934 RepID=UPI0013A5BFE9|nr:uncharacterized protein LOC107318792 [Coturnix japonica]
MTSRPARPGEEAAAAPAAPRPAQPRPPPSVRHLGAPELTASSWSRMPWEGMGHLHLSEERSLEQNGGVMLRSCKRERSFGHFGVGDLEPGMRSQREKRRPQPSSSFLAVLCSHCA